MHNLNYKYYLYAIGLFLLASVVSLWSWNTIAELFSLPLAQYKHVLAAFFLLLILKWALSPSHRDKDRKIGWGCEHQNQ
jgi:hypothetical protein